MGKGERDRNDPQFPRLLGPIPLSGVLLTLGLISTLQEGCVSGRIPAGSAETRPPLPAYVYPPEPPIVGVQELAGLMARLDSDRTLVWLFSDGKSAAQIARLLAVSHDRLRADGVEVLGLYTGAPDNWRGEIVPMLIANGANYPCAVANPLDGSGLKAWLGADSVMPAESLYVLSRSRRVLMRTPGDISSVQAALGQLVSDNHAATRPSPPAALRADVRLIELATGRTSGRAAAQARDASQLAMSLARRIVDQIDPARRLAILPLRSTGPAAPSALVDESITVSAHLGRYLQTAGRPNLVSVFQARDTLAHLGRSPLAVEFDSDGLQGQTHWDLVLVGTLSRPEGAESISNKP